MIQMPAYAIFDMDGTLTDSTAMWGEVCHQVLAAYDCQPPADSKMGTATLTICQTAEYFVQRLALSVSPEQLAQEIRQTALKLYTTSVQCKPGAIEVLKALKKAGVAACVASGTEKPLVDAALSALGVLPYLRFTVACQDDCGKNSPEVYLRALHGLDAAAQPGQAMVFEDSPVAFNTARTAGFLVTAVRDAGNAEAWPEMCRQADTVCESWPLWQQTVLEAAPAN